MRAAQPRDACKQRVREPSLPLLSHAGENVSPMGGERAAQPGSAKRCVPCMPTRTPKAARATAPTAAPATVIAALSTCLPCGNTNPATAPLPTLVSAARNGPQADGALLRPPRPRPGHHRVPVHLGCTSGPSGAAGPLPSLWVPRRPGPCSCCGARTPGPASPQRGGYRGGLDQYRAWWGRADT